MQTDGEHDIAFGVPTIRTAATSHIATLSAKESMKLKWTRVLPGEYRSEGRAGWLYYVDEFWDGCNRCDHQHKGWVLTASPSGLTGKLGEFKTLREAKAAADAHQLDLT